MRKLLAMNETADPHTFEVIVTADGSLTLHHPVYGETYHSSGGAAQEASDLYLGASGFRARLAAGEPVRVLDVGLGLGYNAVAAISAWVDGGGDLYIESLEKDTDLVARFLACQGAWQEDWREEAKALLQQVAKDDHGDYSLQRSGPRGALHWRVIVGDACERELEHGFNFIWQDAFSPKCNAELWTGEWFSKLKSAAADDCILVTYSAARVVKDSLVGAGWSYELISTTTQKRHWMRARPS